VALDWVEVELANLRAGFRWAADQHDLATAAGIAAHAAMLGETLQRFEPAGWAEEILEVATSGELAQLPRLYTAASFCMHTGRPEAAVGYAQTAVALGADSRFDGFDPGWSSYWEAVANLLAGRVDRHIEICVHMAAQPGPAHVLGQVGLLWALPAAGRAQEAMAMAEDTLAAARVYGNPFCIGLALYGAGRAFAQADPARALRVLREGLVYAQEHQLPLHEAAIAPEVARLEALYGDLGQALALFDAAFDSFQRASNVTSVGGMLEVLAVCFDRFDRPDVAATLYGASTNLALSNYVLDLPGAVGRLRAVLGDDAFDQCAATGAAMDLADAVGYARYHIELARRQAANPDHK
jgi:hypothetical protein